MKQVLRKIVPRLVMSLAEKIYWKFSGASSKWKLSQKQYEALTALKCIVSYNKYGGYCVPESSRHRPAAAKVLSKDVYEPDIRALRQHDVWQFYVEDPQYLQCRTCRRQTSVRSGTVFHGSKLPRCKWFQALFLVSRLVEE